MDNNTPFAKRPLCLMVGLFISLSTSLHADELHTQIEEIHVTASKRAQTQDDFVGAISVVRDLDQTPHLNLVDIAGQVPGFNLVHNGPRNPDELVIRGMRISGVGANDLGGDGATVVSYLDNAPLQGYFVPPSINLKDMAQVEVLRGPQGTLYGHSSIGGLLRYSTVKPDLGKSGGTLSTSLSQTHASSGLNHDSYLVVNQPLVSDELGARLLLGREQNAGFIDNPYLLSGAQKDINDDKADVARLSFLWQPSDALHLGLSHHYQKNHADDRQAANKVFTGDDYTASSRYLQPMTNELNLTSLDGGYDLRWAKLEVSLSRYDYRRAALADQTDYFYALDEVYGAFYTLYEDFSGYTTSDFTVEKDSLEVRLVSASDQRVRWLAGLFYTRDQLDGSSVDLVPGFPEAIGFDRPDGIDYYSSQAETLREKAVYAEVSYDITPVWEISVGTRHFELDDDLSTCTTLPILYGIEGTDLPLDCVDGVDKHSDTLGKISTRYSISESSSVYLTLAEGFRRGGANALPPEAEDKRGYLPDQVVNIELGGHSYFLDQRLRVSAAIFHTDWEDIHVYGVLEDRYAITVNAGRAESRGLELEMRAQITPHWALRTSYSLTRAELKENIAAIDGQNDVFAGDRLPGSPRHQIQLAVDYQRPIGNAQLDAGLNLQRMGDITTEPNASFYNYEELPAYTLANARLGVSWRNWRTGAFVHNISNTRAITGRRSDYWYGEQGQFENLVRPRTLGVFVSYTY